MMGTSQKMVSSIKKISYSKFVDFIQDFSFSGKYNHLVLDKRYIYRGEMRDDYELLPSISRKNNIKILMGSLGLKMDSEILHMERMYSGLEFSLLRDFYNLCNENGLPLPESMDILERTFQTGVYTENPPKDKTKFVAALAQHYGIPTRFLDWTKSIDVAIYFASIGVIKALHSDMASPLSKSMTIWILRIDHNSSEEIEVVVPIYATNPNLKAQKGVLVSWDYIHFDSLNIDRPKLITLDTHITAIHGKRTYEPYLYKIQIPTSEALQAYLYLKTRGSIASKLFPGYDGVKREIEENLMFEHQYLNRVNSN